MLSLDALAFARESVAGKARVGGGRRCNLAGVVLALNGPGSYGCRRAGDTRQHGRGRVELAKLALDVALELRAVFALEVAELFDATLERGKWDTGSALLL